jgi:uncharacterized protein (DUF952 family)
VTTSPGGRIFHVAPTGADPSARDQFERHGFVHCCFREQLAEIVAWWFEPGAGADGLCVLELDVDRLTAEVRHERSPSRWYPHVYGPLDQAALVATHPWPWPGAGDPPPSFALHGRIGARDAVVRWRATGGLEGDEQWMASADDAVTAGRPIMLTGGITSPANLDTAYEAFATLELVADAVVAYAGDGFSE